MKNLKLIKEESDIEEIKDRQPGLRYLLVIL